MTSWSTGTVLVVVAALASAVGAMGVVLPRLFEYTDMPCTVHARTGDVVLFRWDRTGIVHDLVSVFSHVGLVVERDGQPWILETHKHGDARALGYEGGGVRAYPLADRVRTYPGAAWVLKLDRTRWQVDSRRLERAFSSLADRPYDEDHVRRLGSCFVETALGVGGSHGSRAMFCSEFVGELLKGAGVFARGYDTACLTPESFAHMPDVYPHMLRLL